MVSSFKEKTKVKETLAEDLRGLRNFGMRDFKIYSDNEETKNSTRRSSDADEWKTARKPPIATRKLVPANVTSKQKVDVENTQQVMGKRVVSVKTKGSRKALADVNNIRSYSLRNRPSDGSGPKKDKSQNVNFLQQKTPKENLSVPRVTVRFGTVEVKSSSIKTLTEKTAAQVPQTLENCDALNRDRKIVQIHSGNGRINGQSHRSLVVNNRRSASMHPAATWKSLSSQRISRSFSLGESKTAIAKGSQHKSSSVMENVKHLEKIKGKSSISVDVKTKRKPLAEISNTRTRQLGGSNDGLKSIRTQSGKFVLKPRLSLTSQKVKDSNRSSKEAVVTLQRIKNTSSKVKMTSELKQTSYMEKKSMSITVNSFMEKEREVVTGPTCEKKALDVSYGCSSENNPSDGNERSSESVTAVISKPRNRRRKSYTSLLMEKSKVLGECADSVKELPNIDDPTNHLEVAEYVDDIYQYYWIMEQAGNPLLENYMEMQTEITPRMRGILINWLIEVHLKFELMQETLFLMVDLLDRFLSLVTIRKDEMQLIGLTALLLASKYEDFWHPKIKDLISISANIYTRDQMLAMEKLILKKLMFRLNAPTPYVFMLRFLKAAQSDQKLKHLAFYLIELCLVEYESLKFKSSMLCASAIYVARCTLQLTPAWTKLLNKHTLYEESQLRPCAEMILRFQRTAGQGQLKVTYEKYLPSNFSCVAGIKALGSLPL